MSKIAGRSAAALFGLICAVSSPDFPTARGTLHGQTVPVRGTAEITGDWPLHNLDVHNSRYSTLDEITAANSAGLALKWTFDLPSGATVGSATPIVVNGVMYFNSGAQVFAVDAGTGRLLWSTEAHADVKPGGRGPVYAEGTIYATGISHVIAVDAKTGQVKKSFGRNGLLHVAKAALDFKSPDRYPADFDPYSIGYMIASAPTYAAGTLYFGVAQADSLIPGGLIVAVDVATGRVTWVFRTIPQNPDDDGWDMAKETWSGELRYGGGVWTQPALDPELGLLYANVSNPSPNFDGSSRKGTNLFTNSIVALSMSTGKLAWHYQAIHHDIWDLDLMTGPTLFDVTIDGSRVKALASLAKSCYVYALNRETGQPLFSIVETPVPTQTDVPGEAVWPTQPIPYNARYVAQQPFCGTFPNVADPELAKRRRPSFHPFQMSEFVIVSPGVNGGPNRGSSSFSPRTGLLYVTGKNDALSIKPRSVGASIAPGPGSPGHFQSIGEQGATGVKPTQNIAAYNPTTGDLVWVTEFPGITNGGNLVTAGDVLFQAIGRDFLAVDATTGKLVTKVPMRTGMSSTPLTYRAAGRQYVAIASGSAVLAFGLP
jgi:quinohemoprotein ethanol dehydrogenase